jgi:hypothetical protein
VEQIHNLNVVPADELQNSQVESGNHQKNGAYSEKPDE